MRVMVAIDFSGSALLQQLGIAEHGGDRGSDRSIAQGIARPLADVRNMQWLALGDRLAQARLIS
jgi:hypothetical protein